MKRTLLIATILAGSFTASQAASVVYEFTGGSLAPTVTGLPAGVTASDFSLGAYTLTDLEVAAQNALRISGDDSPAGTQTALDAGQVLSFSLTITNGVILNLTSLTIDYAYTGGSTAYSNARVYSNIDNSGTFITDTIGVIGQFTGGGTNSTLNLANPTSNLNRGSNVNTGDFDNLTNQTITFSIPWVDGVGATDFSQIDNITLKFVPEPSSALLGGLGLLALLRRRR